jgi:uncharacterized protein (TIGR03067 family)
MRQLSALFGAFLLLTCAAFAGQADDAKKLQGAWALTELIVGGAKVPDKELAGMKFVFEADKLTIVPPTADTDVIEKRSFTIKLEPKKNPAQVEITALDGKFKGTVSPGIYELKGDMLRWCQSDDPQSKDHPKEFASPEKSKIYLFTFKRDGK